MACRILAIDDDPMILHILISILSSEGHEVIGAEHGEAALAFLERDEKPIKLDLIISDVMMPGITGLEFLQKVKSNPETSRIPFVLLTAENKSEDIMQGYTYGADYYIPKPFTRQQLLYGLQLVLS